MTIENEMQDYILNNILTTEDISIEDIYEKVSKKFYLTSESDRNRFNMSMHSLHGKNPSVSFIQKEVTNEKGEKEKVTFYYLMKE